MYRHESKYITSINITKTLAFKCKIKRRLLLVLDILELSRLQFGVTTVYHFFFVPLTLGLVFIVALMETMYVKTGNETYKRMTKFWGHLFLINFAMGVVTGIVQEFQFGMNWSEFSRFVGDIFGAPLAIEALVTFFCESVFIGLWVFGWDKLSKKLHCATIWLVTLGSASSAFWIMAANSFMQQPVGFVINNGRAEMTEFSALLRNHHFHPAVTHVWISGLVTASFFVLGVSAYNMIRKSPNFNMHKKAFRIATVTAVISIMGVLGSGHLQARHIVRSQPMKMAAAEGMWETHDPAPFSVAAVIDEENKVNHFSLEIPYLLSLMSYESFSGEIKGMNELQRMYETEYGPGDYIPPVNVVYWSFRIMIVAGTILSVLLAYAVYIGFIHPSKYDIPGGARMFTWAIGLPFIACAAGWIMTEMGRQPWVVQGIMKTEHAVSPGVSAAEVLISLIGFTVVYGALMAVDIFLLVRYSKDTETTTHTTV